MTIKDFILNLHDLAPMSKSDLMEKYSMSESDAEDELRSSWLIKIKADASHEIINKTNPLPIDLSNSCDFTYLTIGDISLSSKTTTLQYNYSQIGHIQQNVLLYSREDDGIYICEYEMNLDDVQQISVTFGDFLNAFIKYCEYYRWAFVDESINPNFQIDAKSMAAEAVNLTKIVSPNNIFFDLF